MGRDSSRPGGGRPPGRRGRGGIGPGPGYRTHGHGKGTNHKSSFATVPQVRAAVAVFLVMPAVVLALVGAFFLHGYGVI